MIRQKRMKRMGQMEILGLVIVVILILLGLVFVIRFVILKPSDDVRQNYIATQTAANFLSALLKTTTECDKLSITDLVQDCALHYDEEVNQHACGPLRSCAYLEKTVKDDIVVVTLDKWNRQYELRMCEWDFDNIQCKTRSDLIEPLISDPGCAGSTTQESKLSFIPTAKGSRAVHLVLCR